MKRAIYRLFSWLDRKNIKTYQYETAPYCGHHYSGWDGYWTKARYHEGDGYEQASTWFFSVIYYTLDDSWDVKFFPKTRGYKKKIKSAYRSRMIKTLTAVVNYLKGRLLIMKFKQEHRL